MYANEFSMTKRKTQEKKNAIKLNPRKVEKYEKKRKSSSYWGDWRRVKSLHSISKAF